MIYIWSELIADSSNARLTKAAGLARPPVTESGKTGGRRLRARRQRWLQAQALPFERKHPVIYSHNPPFTTHIQNVQACAEQPVRFGAQGRIRTSTLPSRAVPRRGVFKKLTIFPERSYQTICFPAAPQPFHPRVALRAAPRLGMLCLVEGSPEDTGTDSSLSTESRSPRAMSLTTQRRPRR